VCAWTRKRLIYIHGTIVSNLGHLRVFVFFFQYIQVNGRTIPWNTSQPLPPQCFPKLTLHIRGPFEEFVDSPYYSESELCGGAVTVSFLKYLPWQAMHFLQLSTHFSKTCCRPFAASFRRTVEQAVLTFHVRFSVSKALPSFENRKASHYIVSIGLIGFQNSIAQRWRSTKEISSCSAILKRALLKRP
jgi:hypothetical protein